MEVTRKTVPTEGDCDVCLGAFFFFRLGEGIEQAISNAVQFVQGTPRRAASQRTFLAWHVSQALEALCLLKLIGPVVPELDIDDGRGGDISEADKMTWVLSLSSLLSCDILVCIEMEIAQGSRGFFLLYIPR
jgi:hypothetical protein